MKIGRVPLLKSQIKKLKPLLERADEFNVPPWDKEFIIVGQLQIPDMVNELEEPWLKVVMLTGERSDKVHKCVMEQWRKENEL